MWRASSKDSNLLRGARQRSFFPDLVVISHCRHGLIHPSSFRIVSAAGGRLMTKRIEDDGAQARARLRALVAGSLLTLAIFPALGVAAAQTAGFPDHPL